MPNSSGAKSYGATDSVNANDPSQSPNADDPTLPDLLESLGALGIHVYAQQSPLEAFGRNMFFRLTYPIWLHRLRRKDLCQDKDVLQAAKLLDEALKLAMFQDQNLAKNLAMAQINLVLRHGIHAFTSRAVAFWGFFQIGGVFLAVPALRRAVQQATRLLSDHRFRTWQQPIISEWMCFLLPWTFPRRLTTRRIDHLKYGIRNHLEFALSQLGGEYELAANLFATETLGATAHCLIHLKNSDAPQVAGSMHITEFGLASAIARLEPLTKPNNLAEPGSGKPELLQGIPFNGALPAGFKLALSAAVAAILRDYTSVAKTRAILKSNTQGSNWLATMPPVIAILIIHACICEATSRSSVNWRHWMKLLYDIALMFINLVSNRSAYGWAKHLIWGELAASWGMTRIAYSRLRLSRLKAREAGCLLPLAVIQERLSIFSLSEGDQDLGRRQMKEARALFAQWGSGLKLNQLDTQYSHLKIDREKKRVVGKMNGNDQKSPLSEHLNIRLISSQQREKSPNFYLRDLIHLLSPEMGASPQAKDSLTNRVNNYVDELRRRSAAEALLAVSRELNEKPHEKAPGLFIAPNYIQTSELCGDVVFTSYDRKNNLYYFGVGDNFTRGPTTVAESLALINAVDAAVQAVALVPAQAADSRLEVVVTSINSLVARARQSGDNALFMFKIVVLDPQNGAGFYFNASNFPAYLKRGDRIMALLGSAMPLGFDDIDIKKNIFKFEATPGDILFVHTNGLVRPPLEAKNRLTRLEIRRAMLSAQSSEELAANMASRLKALSAAGLIDDAAYVLVAY